MTAGWSNKTGKVWRLYCVVFITFYLNSQSIFVHLSLLCLLKNPVHPWLRRFCCLFLLLFLFFYFSVKCKLWRSENVSRRPSWPGQRRNKTSRTMVVPRAVGGGVASWTPRPISVIPFPPIPSPHPQSIFSRRYSYAPEGSLYQNLFDVEVSC